MEPIITPVPKPRYAHKMELTVDERVAEAFCRENFEDFFEFLYVSYPSALTGFLDYSGDLVMDFLRGDEF